jgi:hypothetical protein
MIDVKDRMRRRAAAKSKKKNSKNGTPVSVPTGHPHPRPSSIPGLDLRIRPPLRDHDDDDTPQWPLVVPSASMDDNEEEEKKQLPSTSLGYERPSKPEAKPSYAEPTIRASPLHSSQLPTKAPSKHDIDDQKRSQSRLPHDPFDDSSNPLYQPLLAPMTPQHADALIAAVPDTYALPLPPNSYPFIFVILVVSYW